MKLSLGLLWLNMADELTLFLRTLPKVELHAHLNGSISPQTLMKLIKMKQQKQIQNGLIAPSELQVIIGKEQQRTLEECFKVFGVIHQLVDDTDAVTLVTCDVITEFAEDGVKYLELRSTPRANPNTEMTKQSYVDAVLLGIEKAKNIVPSIIVRFLLAIDRKGGPAEAVDTVHLALAYQKRTEIVLGVDLSGNPMAYTSQDFVPSLKMARENGLCLALHIAEIPNVEDSKTLLELIPDRIGHGTCLHPDEGGSQELMDIVEKHLIPLELCLTSNLKCKTVKSLNDHHFNYWYKQGHPCTVCTDDKGVFATSLSEEYRLVATTFGLTKEQLWDLSYKSIDYIASGESVKDSLRALWNKEKKKLFPR